MLDILKHLLDYLSGIVDPARQAAIERRHRQALDGQPMDRLPLVVACPLPEDARFKPLPYREAFADPERMLYNELVHAFDTSIALRDRLADDLPLTVRANFGTVLIASMFGARVEQHDDNPPWVRHSDADIPLAAVAERPLPGLARGLLPRVVETMECYHAVLRRWPGLYEQVHIVLPDLQGPLDNLGLIRGSVLLMELASAPREVDAALAAAAAAQVEVARRLAPLVRDGPEGYSHQHAVMIRGNILLRNDSVVMISPAMYREQVAPHDERVLSALGGGGVHCCGRLDHVACELLQLPSIECLDLGQPELNDVDAIYRAARPKNIAVTRVVPTAEELADSRIRDRFPTGVILVYRARTFAEANYTLDTL
ncbi:MAG: hypothetical protein RBS80_05440 [Thermoguttaceae bacterium]|jgi:hypothetical protein|nr:hypothetical protein [Thermoguttaceae bacterium]